MPGRSYAEHSSLHHHTYRRRSREIVIFTDAHRTTEQRQIAVGTMLRLAGVPDDDYWGKAAAPRPKDRTPSIDPTCARPRRPTGTAMLLLGVTLMSPVPFTQIVPAVVIMLLALAYLEEDGLVLLLALVAAVLAQKPIRPRKRFAEVASS